jgi:hypothetical protein
MLVTNKKTSFLTPWPTRSATFQEISTKLRYIHLFPLLTSL